MEYKYQQQEAMENAKTVIQEVDKEFGEKFGRNYGGSLSSHCMEDAEVAILSMGSSSGLARIAADQLREEGVDAGSIKLRVFRPFPDEELKKTVENLRLLIVIDRDASIGMGGIVYSEVAGSLYSLVSKPVLINYVMGLGGRVMTVNQIKDLTRKTLEEIEKGEIDRPIRWAGVRGLE
jgi:2-oxoisovalerate ferredoxin oxidoreductase alpha subunit